MHPDDREQDPRPGDPEADRHWLRAAIVLSGCCPPSAAAFSVGAVLVAGSGELIAAGYSREEDQADHAEEVALRRARARLSEAAFAASSAGQVLAGASSAAQALAGATLYSSLEPCVRRSSRPVTCAELTLSAGVRRVVIAWREPPLFVPGGGGAWLSEHGVTVVEYADLAAAARAANRHLVGG